MVSKFPFKTVSHFRKQFSLTRCLLYWTLSCSPQPLTESLTVIAECEISQFNSRSLYHPRKDPRTTVSITTGSQSLVVSSLAADGCTTGKTPQSSYLTEDCKYISNLQSSSILKQIFLWNRNSVFTSESCCTGLLASKKHQVHIITFLSIGMFSPSSCLFSLTVRNYWASAELSANWSLFSWDWPAGSKVNMVSSLKIQQGRL